MKIELNFPRSRLFVLWGAAAGMGLSLVVGGVGSVARAQPDSGLEVMAENSALFWNGIAVQGDRIFVAGPKALQPPGSAAPSLAVLVAHGALTPYPDAAWNGWRPGDDPRRAFVNVNAIHRDARGGLWAIDSGIPVFGHDRLPGAAKAVRIDLATNRVDRVYLFGPDVVPADSYVNDIRFHGDLAYLTDSGRPGIIVLNLKTGKARRTLDEDPSARGTRPIIVDGKVLRGPDDQPLLVNSDPLEVSPDGQWLYYGPAGGPWSAIETRWLDNSSMPPVEVAKHVMPWADLPPTGGTAMDAHGNLYFSDLAHLGVKKRSPSGEITWVVQDPRLHWVDAPAIDDDGSLWLAVPQIDRAAAFNHGVSQAQLPIQLFRLRLKAVAP